MKVLNNYINNVGGMPDASAEAVKRFQEWCQTIGVEIGEPEARASRIHGKCAADFEDKDPHAEGLEARLAGRPETANPYDPERDGDSHRAWNDGWLSENDRKEPFDDPE